MIALSDRPRPGRHGVSAHIQATTLRLHLMPVSHRAYDLYGQARTVNSYGHLQIRPRYGLVRSARMVFTVSTYGLYGQLLRSLR